MIQLGSCAVSPREQWKQFGTAILSSTQEYIIYIYVNCIVPDLTFVCAPSCYVIRVPVTASAAAIRHMSHMELVQLEQREMERVKLNKVMFSSKRFLM